MHRKVALASSIVVQLDAFGKPLIDVFVLSGTVLQVVARAERGRLPWPSMLK